MMATKEQKARAWKLSDERIATRFWRMVERAGVEECWEWRGRKTEKGYGKTSVRSKPKLAHRTAWTFSHGAIPGDLFVLHNCDNPGCCNPAHLRLGTQADNMEDRRIRRRTARGERIRSAKLSDADVAEIRNSTGLQKDVAAKFGVTPSQVSRIRANKSRRGS